MALSPSPGDFVAILSRLGEADSVTNPPENGMGGRGRKARRRLLLGSERRQGMQDSTDTTRFFGGGTMSLTQRAYGTGSTVSETGGIEDAYCPIVFRTAFLRIERCSLPTPQCAVRLREKVLPCQASCSGCTRPLWGTEGRSSRGEVRRWHRFSSRGGQTRSDALRLVAEAF